MLIKEYRICMPLNVEEYRIAQLYMIQKKSKEESTSQGSSIEIIRNEPYTEGPGGSGQYTLKIYHIDNHLPGWLKSILPKSALVVEEEAWNAYPYTKTKYKVPIIDRFTLELETYYFNDIGEQDNVFDLNEDDKKNRIIDFIDMVADPISPSDYRKDEDPKIYISTKSNRGPLTDNWRSDLKMETSRESKERDIMCAYKLCKVEFRYWGMQTRIEKFIDDMALRKTMLRAHRQVWCWQDEWIGLTIQDIRRLECDTALLLAERNRSFETHDSSDIQNNQKSCDTLSMLDNEYGPIIEPVSEPISNSNNNTDERQRVSDELNSDEENQTFYDAPSEFL